MSEVLGATWGEVDLAAVVWNIPASRIKAGGKYRVPLSVAASELLVSLPRIQGKIFPETLRKRPVSNMAMLMALRRLDRDDITTHGFRSTLRDWVSEATHHPREIKKNYIVALPDR
ncbi:tyrosine-type recombinase/integrase [Pseudomonas fluorescens]|uniref:tyrosine-type recombinase/integrase n=1 Tax=Pseudomonas fluorescens TaxID=294 RepID=UPI00124230C7|nr:tyrosine-type recombinase/integrase [Pseudomonas fluorescens]